MDPLELVDDLYEEFARELGGDLTSHARDLPRSLRLAAMRDAPWSAVFMHEVTLAAPALFAEALPGASLLTVREAVRAHMFAVIDAFGTDRIEDGQVRLTADALQVLERIHAERDASLARLASLSGDISPKPARVDLVTARAMVRERALLRQGGPVDFPTYQEVSLAKQSAGVIATTALARVVGAPPARRRAIQLTLEAIAMGLQLHDDVVDWEDDYARGGAWAVSLMRGARSPVARWGAAEALRSEVLGSGVLVRMLERSRWHMRAASARARVLGALRVAAWTAARAEALATLASAESRSAGYSMRSHALSAWATEVLA